MISKKFSHYKYNEFQSNQHKNPMQPYPLPNDVSHETWLEFAIWLKRYVFFCENMNRWWRMYD